MARLVFIMYKIKRNWILIVKKASLSAMINKVQLIRFIFRKQQLLKELKFTNSYDNSSFSKPDKNTENPEYLITYEVELEDNPNTKREGHITRYPIQQRKRPDFL